MRRLAFAIALLVAVAAGVTGASVVSAGPSPPQPPDPLEPVPGLTRQIGPPVADPVGGPPWAVRTSVTPAGVRCIMAGRVEGASFGPVDSTGRVRDTPPSFSGSCAEPGSGPLQVALARYPATAAGTARSVLFGVADGRVMTLVVDGPGGSHPIAPDRFGAFVVVEEGSSDGVPWEVRATLRDGTQQVYSL